MRLAKLLYLLLFCLVLPALLIVWARAAEPMVRLPVLRAPVTGVALAAVGLVLLLAGTAALWRYGGGLPMNAFPPPRYVTGGIYRWLSHPIYVAFSALCAGLSLAVGSAAGLWLVSPLVMLASAALVVGYERPDLRRRFGTQVRTPLMHLPLAGDGEERPAASEVVSVYILVFLPWLLLYEAVGALGVPPDAVSGYFGWEWRLPVWEASELVYISTYPFVLLAPLLAKNRRELRRFALQGLAATALGVFAFLLVPLVSPPRPFVPQGLLGRLLLWERQLDFPTAAFPSFHVFWAFLAAHLIAARGRGWRAAATAWAALIAVSCMTAGNHALADVLGGLALFALASHLGAVWEALRRGSERVANSWREWRIGPLRVINHGAYAFGAALLGELIVGALVGAKGLAASALAAACGLIGAALWAQGIEGSPRLLRPFGYYGFVTGAVAGALLAPAVGCETLLLLAALATAAPWAQAVGRLRCLVQGCCHGRPAAAAVGIRHHHPSSRVTRLAGLAGLPIHATQLYSLLGNLAIGLILARLYSLHAPLVLVLGLYLALSGLARFVEESFRGEPQTRRLGGLPIYQWLAIASTVAGAVVTALPQRQPAPPVQWNAATVPVAVALGLLAGLAMGVDLPDSQRRFARLSG
ncbi:MAG TPA: prolipoprotein diacylglyceryl transferase family protein [Thermoanaerobaculia bacterium]|nr:prolipoprotein diacylglyceryl transferase family protein [Thermoanaerobaculia bacterium]